MVSARLNLAHFVPEHWRGQLFPAPRQIDGKGRPMSFLAVAPDVSPILLDDAVNCCQTKACPFTFLFRGEEGLEEVRLRLFAHPDSSITDGEQYVFTRA